MKNCPIYISTHSFYFISYKICQPQRCKKHIIDCPRFEKCDKASHKCVQKTCEEHTGNV